MGGDLELVLDPADVALRRIGQIRELTRVVDGLVPAGEGAIDGLALLEDAQARREVRDRLAVSLVADANLDLVEAGEDEIGRASCRERVLRLV